jgi:putative membrane protein
VDQRSYRTFQALILGGLGVFLLACISAGTILFYINQRFVILVLGGAILLILLAQVVLQARNNETGPSHEHEEHAHLASTSIWLLGIPLLIGVLVPQRPLGASAVALRGLQGGASLIGRSANPLSSPPAQRDVLDWMRVVESIPDQEAFNNLSGQPADLIGFVYRDGTTPSGSFYVARFDITCCVADATAIGLRIDWPGGDNLAENAWVRVKGSVEPRVENGRRELIIRAVSVESIPMPEQPYLFQ